MNENQRPESAAWSPQGTEAKRTPSQELLVATARRWDREFWLWLTAYERSK